MQTENVQNKMKTKFILKSNNLNIFTNHEPCVRILNIDKSKNAHNLENKSIRQIESQNYFPKTKSGKKMTGCYSPWRLVANKLGVVSHHAR